MLSTTAKAKERQRKKEAEKAGKEGGWRCLGLASCCADMLSALPGRCLGHRVLPVHWQLALGTLTCQLLAAVLCLLQPSP